MYCNLSDLKKTYGDVCMKDAEILLKLDWIYTGVDHSIDSLELSLQQLEFWNVKNLR